jgi:hypothetical protein
MARVLLSRRQGEVAMLSFTVGLWLGAALGACCMGALWEHERRDRHELQAQR